MTRMLFGVKMAILPRRPAATLRRFTLWSQNLTMRGQVLINFDFKNKEYIMNIEVSRLEKREVALQRILIYLFPKTS